MDLDIFDPQYVAKQQIAALQRQADEQNALHQMQYESASRDWVVANLRNRDMGLAISPAPTKPGKWVVSADGQMGVVTWDELKAPELPPPVAPSSNSLRPAASAVPPDRTDQLIGMMRVVNEKLDRLLAR